MRKGNSLRKKLSDLLFIPKNIYNMQAKKINKEMFFLSNTLIKF